MNKLGPKIGSVQEDFNRCHRVFLNYTIMDDNFEEINFVHLNGIVGS